MVNKCPVCGQNTVGKVGSEQYFCWSCCVEFTVNQQGTKIFNVQDDGTLTVFSGPKDLLRESTII